MTKEERLTAFMKEFQELQEKWGVVFVARIQSKFLTDEQGVQIQHNAPVIMPAFTENWTQPTSEPATVRKSKKS